jgi:hypothetical protein
MVRTQPVSGGTLAHPRKEGWLITSDKGNVMLINFDPLRDLEEDRRTHPWGKTAYNERGGFYSNFIKNPELITEVLEDFKPHEDRGPF